MDEILRVTVNVIVVSALFALLILIIGGATLLVRRGADPIKRSRLLKRVGMGIMGTAGFFVSSFIVGETFLNPGGWEAVGLVSLWLVPLGLIGAIAWFKPSWGVPLLTVLAAGVVALEAWAAFDVRVRRFEDRVGPITLVALFAIALAITALGHSKPKAAGALLILTGLLPVVLTAAGTVKMGPGAAGIAILVVPMALTGTLYWMSDRLARGSTQPPGVEGSGESESRKAA